MKKLLLFFLLIGMYAKGEITFNQQKKEGVPNISTFKQNISGDIFADFLFWYASEETSSTWASDAIITLNDAGVVDIFNVKSFTFDWDFGFRIGAGYTFSYDRWDTQLYWSWFRTKAGDTRTEGDILSQFFGGFINGDIAQSAQLQWKLLYNMFDWELGRSYWISKGLSLRPFVGLKGGWIHQNLQSQWHVTERDDSGTIIPVNYDATENLKNNFWGIGPSGGINTKWKLGPSDAQFFNVFGDFSTAMLWGTWICKDIYTNPTPTTISTNMNNVHLGGLMLRGFMGFGWDVDFLKSHFNARLGYEMQFWINQLRLPTFQQLRLHGDLTLQGGTFNCRFDF